MAFKKYFLLLSWLLLAPFWGHGQGRMPAPAVVPRLRVIVDNDFAGDPDGLFQLVHLLLSPSVDVRGIIGSRMGEVDSSPTQADEATQKAAEVLRLLHRSGTVPVLAGANRPLPNDSTPVDSPGAELIRQEALRTDTSLPLYVLCGAGLTQIASAALRTPSIADHLTLVWIGGPEYPDLALPPPGPPTLEFNTSIDLAAAQAVFNRTRLPLWQVPRDAYRQVLLPTSQLVSRVKPRGRIGAYLFTTLDAFTRMIASEWHQNTGETYVLGDSPLVLLTALQSSAEADPSSSRYVPRHAPRLTARGTYAENARGRLIRVYTHLDSSLLLNDFLAKLELLKK